MDDASHRDAPGVSPAALQAEIDSGEPVRVLDLRDRDEVERWHLAGPAVTLTQKPHNRFVQARVTDAVEEFVADVEGKGPITVVCARGEASASVAAELVAAGYDARNLSGGMEGWARLLLSAAVDAVGDAELLQYRRPASGCLGYAILSDGEAAVVDPLRAFTDRYVADIRERGATVEYVVDTHVHADHVSGLRALAEATGADPVMPAASVERGVTYDVRTIEDGDEVAVGNVSLTAVAAPGHTTDMTAVAVGDALLTGDSLFVDGVPAERDRDAGATGSDSGDPGRRGRHASVARPDLEAGADGAADLARELYRTLTERFAGLPDGTVVAPGHHGEGAAPGADGTVTAPLGECRRLWAFDATEAEFVDRVAGATPPRPANHERIVAVNLGRDDADADAAFELELGPNNCAAAPADD